MRRGCQRCQRRVGPTASQRQTVERAEAYLRAHVGTRVPLSAICRLVGLSERGLRNAFYSVRGVGPKRWMLAERLQSVRRVLRNERSRPITVTSAATDYGFFELGRFAASYKKAFGERPSETLRGTPLNSTSKSRRTRKEDHDVCTSQRNQADRTGLSLRMEPRPGLRSI